MFLSRRVAQRRSFVSTVLLSRTWDNETLVELRKVAKARGLSTKGNKSALIARIQEHEKNGVHATSAPPTSRNTSSNAVSSKNASQAVSPGILPAMQSVRASTNSDFFAIKLPDLSQHPPNAPVQVPYVPDFWNSARSKPEALSEPELPKLHVVSGSATRYDGGPTYNLERLHEDSSPPTIVQAHDPPVRKEVGFWADFWESLGPPRSFSARRTLTKAGKAESQMHSRPLTDEERRGLYIILGIVGGSWLVGALVNRPATIAEERDQH